MKNIIEIENDLTIKFNDEEFPVNKELICYYSPVIKELIEENENENFLEISNQVINHLLIECDIHIQTPPPNPIFSNSSFQTFLDACQNRSYSINASNFYTFRDLSFIFKVTQITKECNTFQQHIPQIDLLIPHLMYKIKINKKNTSKLISQISVNFHNFVLKKDLLDVPFEYLKQIIEQVLNKDDHHKPDQSIIFNFLTKKYSQDEKTVSLFQLLDPKKFTVYELKWILDHPQIDTNFIEQCYDINSKIKTLNDQINERQEKINGYSENLEKLETKHPYHNIRKNVHKLKEIIKPVNENDEENNEKNIFANFMQEIEEKINSIFDNKEEFLELDKQIKDNLDNIGRLNDKAEDIKTGLGAAMYARSQGKRKKKK